MMKNKHLLLSLAIWLPLILWGQDAHFTLNQYAPIYFNPAQTGAFSGTYRINAIYRDQNRAGFNTSWTTPMVNVDSPIMHGFKKNHWVGAGINLYADRGGDSRFGSSGFIANGAYHIGLDKKLKRVITVGANYGFVSRNISNNADDRRWGDQISNGGPGFGSGTATQENFNFQEFNAGYGTLGAGLLFKSPMGKTSSMEIGVSGLNLLGGNYMFGSTASGSGTGGTGGTGGTASRNNEIDLRLNGHIAFNMMVADRLAFAPVVYYSMQGPTDMIVAQANFAYQVNKTDRNNPTDPFILLPGIGYRVGRDLQLMMGAEYKKYRVTIAYDLALGDASNISRTTALELGIQRIFAIPKKPDVKPVIFCPRI